MSATPDSTLANPEQRIADLERQLAERDAELAEAGEQQAAIAEVLQVINSSPSDLAPVFDVILQKAHALCASSHGALFLRDGERFLPAAMSAPELLAAPLRQGEMGSDAPLVRPLLAGEPFAHIKDLTLVDHPLARAAVAVGVRTLLSVPLRKGGTLIGMINAARFEVHPFSDKQIALLQNFAAQAVIAMENARLLAETRAALEQQTATAEILRVISGSPTDLQPTLDAIAASAAILTGAANGAVSRFDGSLIHLVAQYGWTAEELEIVRRDFPRPLGPESTTGRAILTREVVHLPDAAADSEYGLRSVLQTGMRTGLSVPILEDGNPVGAITVTRREVAPFSQAQVSLLKTFADQAVIAIENVRLFNELSERTRELQEALEQRTATAEVLGVINSSPGDLAPVFEAMLEKAMRLSDSVYGHLLTYDGEFFDRVAVRGNTRMVERQSLRRRAESGITLERIVRGESVVQIADVIDTDAYRGGNLAARVMVDEGDCRTLLTVALRKEDILLGTLSVYRRGVRPFSDKQIALLQNFAAQAVIAIENARLLTETREALEQQTATAEVLQVINSSPGDLAPVFDAMLEKACRLCGFAFGSLQIYDGQKFHGVAARGVPDSLADWLAQGYAVGADFYQQLAEKGHVHLADLAELDHPAARKTVELSGMRTALHVALRKDTMILGRIIAGREEVRPFSDKQIALLQNFAAQAVIAMENARLLDELRQRTDQVAELNRGLEARVAEQVEELGRVGRLKRFLAPQLAELIVSQGDEKVLESHRREIVVVFCDLRGYTAFTETAEPEEVLDFLREYHGALGPLVAQFEGTLDQFSGDGIMVFFNDPVPIPDPAERAVKMAVAMREAAGALIAVWRRRDRELGFGVGIAQGYATLGQIGFAERSGYTAIGTVCNLAARLCAEAKDGQILISGRVAAGIEKVIPLEDLGSLALKGISQPVSAFNVPLAATQPALRVIEGGPPGG
jgi:adenylate cyclase